MYRLDTSTREVVVSGGQWTQRRARARRARAAARDPDARLRAAQAAQHHPRHVPRVLLRLALPVPQAAARRRADHGGRAVARRDPPGAPRREPPNAPRPPSRSSTSSRPRARSTSRSSSPRPARPRGRTRGSACTSPSSGQTERRGTAAHPRRPAQPARGAARRAYGRAARTRERLDSYTLELQHHGLESVEREVRWLNELIDTERRASRRAKSRNPRKRNIPGVHAQGTEPRAASRPGRQLIH